MLAKHTRKLSRPEKPAEFFVLVLEPDIAFAQGLKLELEKNLPVKVVRLSSVSATRLLLNKKPHQFFLSISTVSFDFRQVDLLKSFNIPVIAVIDQYDDDLCNQLIKKNVLDYVVKITSADNTYICDLVARIFKNQKIKVLVIDEYKESQIVIARALALQKLEVLQLDNGLVAVNILGRHDDVKLVLIDSHMKLVDGIALVKKIRERYPKDKLLIIGMSTSTDPRLAVKFLKAGANDFILKPFNYEWLLCRINQNLDMLDAVEYANQLSNIDYLSDAFNRRYFFEQGNQIVGELRRKSDVLTVVMIDIDNFKTINDVYGHDVGDEVIKDIAAALKQYFPEDIVARMGGEEFAVMSTSPQYLNSFERIEKFREKIANQVLSIKGHTIQYTCSMGVSGYVGKSLDDMLVQADRLLYLAKKNGRNRVEGQPIGSAGEINIINGVE